METTTLLELLVHNSVSLEAYDIVTTPAEDSRQSIMCWLTSMFGKDWHIHHGMPRYGTRYICTFDPLLAAYADVVLKVGQEFYSLVEVPR